MEVNYGEKVKLKVKIQKAKGKSYDAGRRTPRKEDRTNNQ
jgi:hypothetical protein